MAAIDYSKIDEGIRDEVRALNELGVETISCCSGHEEINNYTPYLVYKFNTTATTALSGILNNYKVGHEDGPFYFNRFAAIVRPYDEVGDTPSINLCCKDPSIENNKAFKKLLGEWIVKMAQEMPSMPEHRVRTKQEIHDLVESIHPDETNRWDAKRVKYELSAHHGSLDMDLSTKQSISDTKAIVVMSDKLEFELIIEKVYPIDNTGSIRIYKTKTYLPSRTAVVSNLKLQCELLDNHTVDEALSHMRRACIPGRAARCVIHLDSHDIIITVTQVLKTTTSSIEIQPV